MPQYDFVVWSFFSGAMGLDIGFGLAGLPPNLCVEIDPKCCETIRSNRPDVCLVDRSVCDLTAAELRELTGTFGDVDIVIGGPPCQSFSTGGNRCGLSDPRGNLIFEYLRLVNEIRPRHFLLENVASLVTAALSHRPIKDRPGQRWNLSSYSQQDGSPTADGAAPMQANELGGTAIRRIIDEVRVIGYDVRFGVLDAAEYGAPQHRRRFIMLASRDGAPPPLPRPTHGPDSIPHRPFMTLRDVIADLMEDPGPHSNYGNFMARFYALVPPGGNWRDIPKELQEEALGASYAAGGGKTGFFRRLDWDKPAPTITGKANRKATGLCHPQALRPLSVKECARIQGFPDDWAFAGSMHDAYQQIGNAVPVKLGEAVGRAVLEALRGGAAQASEAPDVAYMLDEATRRLRAAARNNGRKRVPSISLFDASGADNAPA